MYQVGPPGHSGDLCWVQCIWSLSCSCRFNFTWPIHIMFSYLSCGDCCHKEITRQAQRRGLVCAALDEAISPDLDILSAGGFLPLGFRRYSSMHMYIYIYTYIYIYIYTYIHMYRLHAIASADCMHGNMCTIHCTKSSGPRWPVCAACARDPCACCRLLVPL